jgi:serine phosphatase RsbU (regulator of sigma subunit)
VGTDLRWHALLMADPPLQHRLGRRALTDAFRDEVEQATSSDEVFSLLQTTLVPALADACFFDLLLGPAQRTVWTYRVPDGFVGKVAAPRAATGLLSTVLLEGRGAEGLDVPSMPRQREAEPVDAEHMRRLRAVGSRQFGVVPLRTRTDVLGAITLVRTSMNPLTAADLVVARMLGHRAALTLQRLASVQRHRSVSAQLQRSLLPRLPHCAWLDLFASYVPAHVDDEVGGDWYDAFLLAPDLAGVAVGDVAGHDLRAAAEMAQIRNLLRACAWRDTPSPRIVLEHLDDVVSGLDVTTMATTLYATIVPDAAGALLTWSSAGHPPPLLIPHAGAPRLLDTEADPPLAAAPHLRRSQHEQRLRPGDVVVLYSDGLVERRGEDLNEGLARLLRAAEDLARGTSHALCNALQERLILDDCEDDVVLLAIGLLTA